MAIDFKRFCKNRVIEVKLTLPPIVEDVPEIYKPTMERVLADVDTRMGAIDRSPIPYIQETIEYVDNMDLALKYTNGDVPDALLNTVSTRLFGKEFNDTDIEEQSIIIVVSLYICVARNGKIV